MPALNNSGAYGGLMAVRMMSGAELGLANEYSILAANGSATFIGDPIEAQNTQDTADGTPNVILWATGAHLLLGSVQSVKPTLTNLTLQYRVASTFTKVNIHDDPLTIFRIEDDGTALTGDVFEYATMVVGSGSTTTGQSAAVLHEASVTGAGTTSLPLKIRRAMPALGNTIEGTANTTVYEVIIVNHTFLQNATTALL